MTRAADDVTARPVKLAEHVHAAHKKWTARVYDRDDADYDDPLLNECIENGWTLDGYLGLYLTALPLEQRMEAMGMRHYGSVDWDAEEERDVVQDPLDVSPGADLYVAEEWVLGA